MERFLLQLRALSLARIEVGLKGSTFIPGGVSDASRTRPGAYLGSTAVQELDKLPRYGATPAETEQLSASIKLVAEMNRALSAKFERGYSPIPLDNLGSIAAAKKILKVVPIERALALVFEACMSFTPDKTGGDLPRSLGHPFILKYVINEYRRIERELARGQLSLLFVERTGSPGHVYGARRPDVDDPPPAKPETIAWVVPSLPWLAVIWPTVVAVSPRVIV